jgi:hypothetical protein
MISFLLEMRSMMNMYFLHFDDSHNRHVEGNYMLGNNDVCNLQKYLEEVLNVYMMLRWAGKVEESKTTLQLYEDRMFCACKSISSRVPKSSSKRL